MSKRTEIRYIGEDGVPVKFSGCEVCYTCTYFCGDLRCYWPEKEIEYGEIEYGFVGEKIKRPEWQRCGLWKSKDDYKKRRKKT